MSGPLKLAVVAGETSGDALAAKLMGALKRLTGAEIAFVGVGGAAMENEGLKSFFPIEDIHVMGLIEPIRRLPLLLRRIRETAEGIVAARPDGLIIVDSPDFTHRVARRVRAALPQLPVVDYVSPSVWAWRPGRAKAMRAYVDRVLALLPFEPEAHRRLGGPPCVYVGHPLIERLADLRPDGEGARRREAHPPLIAVLPGSRRSEIARLSPSFGAALALLKREFRAFDVGLPTLPHVEAQVRTATRDWEVQPRIVVTEADKLEMFRGARAALAASGTATLELALAGVPLVGAYRVSRIEEQLKHFIVAPSILLPNLVLGERAIPELLQNDCTPEKIVAALKPLLCDTPERAAQLAALARLDASMRLPDGLAPSESAARATLEAFALGAITRP